MVALGVAASASATPIFAGLPGSPAPLDDPDPGQPTNPYDPRCAGMPGLGQCQGGPYAPINGPASPGCISMPTDPACAGGPYGVPPPPPAPPQMPPPAPDMAPDMAPPMRPPDPEMAPLPMPPPRIDIPEAPAAGGMPGMPGHI
ncbi:hypothetical protein [Mycobacterium sp. HNNTM2301]|uniref:hypothetical protein n=1 Tax=Mycobacterium hainanense TaxID=3289775 RepID=UPI0035A655F8